MQRISIGHRHQAKRRSRLLSGSHPHGLALEMQTAGNAPRLGMREPEDTRSALVSGSITALLHVAAFASLFLLAWLAPPIEEIIPVKIIRELPGAKAPPAPARKILEPRRIQRPVQAAKRVTAQPVAQPRVVKMTAEQFKLNQLRKAAAPQDVQRRQVVSRRTTAREINTQRVATPVDVSKLTTVAAPTQVDAPEVYYDGPVEIVASEVPLERFDEVPNVAPVEYSSAAPVEIQSDAPLPEDLAPFEFDTDMGLYAGGEGAGGTGSSVGTVACMESAFVVRYQNVIVERMKKRWQVPEGTPDNSTVKLRFILDTSGAATKVEFVGDTDPALGNSAVAAMRSASPFPSMDHNTRCLAGERLTATFTVADM